MSGPPLSGALRRFILARIPSIPALEALLLLRSKSVSWPLAELAGRLYVTESQACALVEELSQQGLATVENGQALYAPGPDEAPLIDELATVYARRLVEVTHLVHSTTDHRAQRFADAFVIRKERQ